MEDEHDYDRVDFPGASDDDDEIYKVPRNVVSCFCTRTVIIYYYKEWGLLRSPYSCSHNN